jgi:hypothetical protein
VEPHDHLGKVVDLDRFDHLDVEPGRDGLGATLFGVVSGNGNRWSMTHLARAHLANDPVPVVLRQKDVAHDGVWRRLPEDLDGPCRRCDRRDLGAEAAECDGEHVTKVGVVVDDENPDAFDPCRGDTLAGLAPCPRESSPRCSSADSVRRRAASRAETAIGLTQLRSLRSHESSLPVGRLATMTRAGRSSSPFQR